MAESKFEKEELKKMEEQAYFELCQIIAEAMQLQDITLLDYRISSWKNKYKKLLDGLASPEFKKKIEYLLNEYYSSVTQYIYSQIKFKENKKIENQSKALVKLYRIIKETNDLKTLTSKVKDWENKYPKSSFLKMYQKKIDSYTSRKNLEANAFNQDEAFSDLVAITKRTATFEEFSKAREEWEKKYSIHNKFELKDFIKHQSEVSRYTSDEYLHSISRNEVSENEPSSDISKTDASTTQPEVAGKSYSDLSKQAAAYAKLLAISQRPNNVNEMFKWVYKNSSLSFNDKYKELILNATYLDYSPTYLDKLKTPNLDINNKSLSYGEFNEINDIKKYAIISYFNLLLPPNEAISNNFFNSCIRAVYTKSEEAKHTNASINELTSEALKDGIKIKLSKPEKKEELKLPELKSEDIKSSAKEPSSNKNVSEEKTNPEEKLQEDLSPKLKNSDEMHTGKGKPKEVIVTMSPILAKLTKAPQDLPTEINSPEIIDSVSDEPILVKNPDGVDKEKENTFKEDIEVFSSEPILEVSHTKFDLEENEKEVIRDSEQAPLQQQEIITISPLLFSLINNKAIQAKAIEEIESDVNNYVLSVSRTIPDNIQTKQKEN